MNKPFVTNPVNFKRFFKTIIAILPLIYCSSQIAYAEASNTITSAKTDSVTVYSGPSSSKRIENFTIGANEIKEKEFEVIDDAMNGRFLKINYNGKDLWIKAKQVNTSATQEYDVGVCDKQNKPPSGIRAAVNCTK